MNSHPQHARPANSKHLRINHKAKRGSASAQLHDSLRDRIIQLQLAPGQYLSRNEIAAEYGVSQTPVRDALIKLEEEGLIDTFPQSKTEVSRIDIEHALETQFLRLSIELEITRNLAQAADPARISNVKDAASAVREHLSGTLAKVDDIRKRHPNFF